MPAIPPLKQFLPKPDVKAGLVQRILDRTKESKFTWEKTAASYSGKSKDGSVLATISLGGPFIGDDGWSRFRVTRNGEELLNFENGLSILTLSGAGSATPKQLISELVEYLEEQRLQGVRDAIAVLDRL